MSEAGFWDDQERARDVVSQVKTLKGWVEPYDRIAGRLRSALELDELLAEQPDAELTAEVERESESLAEEVEAFELRSLLRGPDDIRSAQIEISAGAGGTEAQDWAQMLMRMYMRWAERRGFAVEILDLSEGEEAGIKGTVLEVTGDYAYGFLRAESGVHRLVRISPFDSQARRHTSFASVFIYPVVDDTINIEVREEDIRMDVFRASGAGGQHVNKTSSAVRLTHIPTGVVVSCQNEKSQLQNKASAMVVLKAKLLALKKAEEKAHLDGLRGDVQASWGDQMRNYVLNPYQIVKDLRTSYESGNPSAVFDGDLDGFLEAGIRWRRGAEKADAAS